MKRTLLNLVYAVAVLVLVLTACAPKTIAPPLATQPPATEPPMLATATLVLPTEPPTLVPTVVDSSTPTLVPIDLSGPVMEIGSIYPYVDGSVLVAVPAGAFIMGHGADDNPEHMVSLNEFWIYRDEVTNKQYALCVALGKCSLPNLEKNTFYENPLQARKPVIGVNWDQAQAYCQFVNGRLPTEAEWEKTARGPDGNTYPWGEAGPSCNLANIGRCNATVVDVNDYPDGRSYYGAMDMAGNVFEWVADWYGATYYSRSPAENPLGPDFGDRRSVRSTSFGANFYEAEAARRWRELPAEQRNDLGFRCVVEDPSQFAPWCQLVAYVGPNMGGGGQPTVPTPIPDCPVLSASTAGFCNTNLNPKEPAATVNMSPDAWPAGSTFSVPGGCSPDGTTADPNDYYCTSGGMVTIWPFCTVPPPPAPAGCDPGYTQNGNLCEWTGGGTLGTQCLPGITYDPATQCCGSTPGVGDSYTLCPADAPYYGGGVCQAGPVSDFGPLQTYVVTLGSCSTQATCTEPSQYLTQSPCVSAGCKWVRDQTQNRGYCTYP